MSTRIKVKPDATYQYIAGETYTVPMSKWALAKVQVESGGTCTINGKVILKSNTWSVVSSNASPRVHSVGTAASKAINVSMLSSGSEATGTGSGGVVSTVTTDAGDMFANSTAVQSQYAEYSLLPGDTITGTSGAARIFIEEFYG